MTPFDRQELDDLRRRIDALERAARMNPPEQPPARWWWPESYTMTRWAEAQAQVQPTTQPIR